MPQAHVEQPLLFNTMYELGSSSHTMQLATTVGLLVVTGAADGEREGAHVVGNGVGLLVTGAADGGGDGASVVGATLGTDVGISVGGQHPSPLYPVPAIKQEY